ncbi:MAG: protein kinase [Myxococcota bacterium]
MSAFGRYTLTKALGAVGPLERFDAEGPDGRVILERAMRNFAGDDAFREGFVRAAEKARALDGPHVIHTQDVGTVDGVPYVAFERFASLPLTEVVAAAPDGRLSVPQLTCLVFDLARALDSAHFRIDGDPVLHRGVVPDNIFVGEDGTVKLARFALNEALSQEQVSRTGLLSAQLQYMAPEYSETGVYTASCDLFSLGVVLYEAVSGKHPFEASNAIEMSERMLEGDFKKLAEIAPHAPALLVNLCERLIQATPDERFENATVLVSKLETVKPSDGDRKQLADLVATATSSTPRSSGLGSSASVSGPGPAPMGSEVRASSPRPSPPGPPRPAAPTSPAFDDMPPMVAPTSSASSVSDGRLGTDSDKSRPGPSRERHPGPPRVEASEPASDGSLAAPPSPDPDRIVSEIRREAPAGSNAAARPEELVPVASRPEPGTTVDPAIIDEMRRIRAAEMDAPPAAPGDAAPQTVMQVPDFQGPGPEAPVAYPKTAVLDGPAPVGASPTAQPAALPRPAPLPRPADSKNTSSIPPWILVTVGFVAVLLVLGLAVGVTLFVASLD